MEFELKPCPFCGGEAKLREFRAELPMSEERNEFFVICHECGCIRSPGSIYGAVNLYYQKDAEEKKRKFQEQAVKAWNQRSETIDAEKVVRCKDCAHYFEFGNWCNKNSCAVSENDFCSRAEKSQLVKLPKHGETT